MVAKQNEEVHENHASSPTSTRSGECQGCQLVVPSWSVTRRVYRKILPSLWDTMCEKLYDIEVGP